MSVQRLVQDQCRISGWLVQGLVEYQCRGQQSISVEVSRVLVDGQCEVSGCQCRGQYRISVGLVDGQCRGQCRISVEVSRGLVQRLVEDQCRGQQSINVGLLQCLQEDYCRGGLVQWRISVEEDQWWVSVEEDQCRGGLVQRWISVEEDQCRGGLVQMRISVEVRRGLVYGQCIPTQPTLIVLLYSLNS